MIRTYDEPRAGLVWTYSYSHAGESYIMLAVRQLHPDRWSFDLLGRDNHHVYRDYQADRSILKGVVVWVDPTDADEALFMQAMLYPESLKEIQL